ncbi:alginate O-acetyltransferase AlgX-related protein [Dankookia sp. P2]|uniref:alginate O-acetyltransferase AlgX-related protein n=1 Tax=Dankookia sp. P2 TaxID=3423955 RepID=UPI003D67A855
MLQSVSYLVDLYRGDVPASRRFVDYAAYKAIFSQLIAGPIVRYAEIERDLRSRSHRLALFGLGARRFMLGFAAKVLVADTLAPLVEAAFTLPAPTLAEAWAGAVAYSLQLLFDFAGYSAMAIGLALMCGFRFPENFDHPYLSGSIQEFWQRWHMTLSRFLRDYLYIPLGGSRRGPLRTYLNLLATMLIGGFWHGANWTFLLWGAWHGGLLALHRGWSGRGHRLPWILGNPLLMLAVVIGWVTFRAPSITATFGDVSRHARAERHRLLRRPALAGDAGSVVVLRPGRPAGLCAGAAARPGAGRAGAGRPGGGAAARLRHRHRRALQPRRGTFPLFPVLRRRCRNLVPALPRPTPWRCSPCSAGAPGRAPRRCWSRRRRARIAESLTLEAFLGGRTAAAVNHAMAHGLAGRPAAARRRRGAALGRPSARAGRRCGLGCDGWLFLTEESRPWPDAAAAMAERAAALGRIRARLAAEGVAPAGRRGAGQGAYRGGPALRRPRAAEAIERLPEWLGLLRGQGVPALSLHDALAAVQPAFWRTDTHWNQAGAAAAAAAIAAATAGLPLRRAEQISRTVAAAAEADGPGDLLRLMSLDRVPDALRPAPDRQYPERTEASGEAAGLLEETPPAEVVLLGSSYSMNANFHGRLQQALASGVASHARAGGGFAGAAREYFTSAAWREARPTLLVWEIPERVVGQPVGAAERGSLAGW